MSWFHETGGLIGTLISSAFLLLFAFLNLTILLSVYKRFRQVKAGYKYKDEDLDLLVANQGGF